MKPMHSLLRILGSVIFISHLNSGVAVASEQIEFFTTSTEVQNHANNIADTIRQTAISILEVPSDHQTFENTIKPWSRLSSQVVQGLRALNNQNTTQIADDLYTFWLEVSQDSAIHQALTKCSMNTALNPELNPFEQYIGIRLINNESNHPAYFKGISEEQSSCSTDFSILNLQSGPLSESQSFDLVNRILSQNADVVCIQEIRADDHAYNLYENLKESYGHFIYIPPAATLDHSENTIENGMLIASKFHIEQPHFNTFLAEGKNDNEGFFDFILKNDKITLGHIYAANIKKDAANESITHKFVQIMEKMYGDIINIEDESIPFVLCGDILSLKGSEQSKWLLDTYFQPQDNISNVNCTLLLQSLPNLLTNIDNKPTIFTTQMTMPGNRPGLHSVVKRTGLLSMGYGINSIVNPQQPRAAEKPNAFIRGELVLLPVLSRRNDNDNGGTEGRIEARVTATFGGADGPKVEVSANGEIYDGRGNSISGSAGYNITSGEGSVSFGGEARGTISEKD